LLEKFNVLLIRIKIYLTFMIVNATQVLKFILLIDRVLDCLIFKVYIVFKFPRINNIRIIYIYVSQNRVGVEHER